VYKTGGPEMMQWEEIPTPKPGPGEVLIRNTAIGLNFLDTYFRNGLYPAALPLTLGSEGAGVIESLGPKVKDFKVGDHVGYVDPIGSYAERVVRPAHRLVKIPRGVDDQVAAAVLLKGMTAEYLLKRTYKVKRGQTILVHAAAGGVGQILCQWAKHLGATVIGTVGSEEKAKLVKKLGCKHVIITSKESFPERVREITKGKGVPVVYDGVGKDTFSGSLECLSPLGLMVSYGNASGAVPPFSISVLSQKGSLYLTRPTLNTYVAKREDLVKSARELFSVIKKGVVKISIGQTYPLSEAAQAHRDLESRKTTGSTLLLP
jgi:NADPH2:quinone reductase